MNREKLQDIIFRYWGKAGSKEDGSHHLLVWHALDVAAVGQILLDQHPFLLDRLAGRMQLSHEQARRWCVFLLGLHDLGKFAETFQQLRPDLRQKLWPDEKVRRRNYSIRHDSLGWMLWRQHLGRRVFPDADEALHDWLQDGMPCWLGAVFGHHGWPPEDGERIKRHFRDFDQQAALAFFEQWRELIQPDFAVAIQNGDALKRQREAGWLLAGIAVLADWLGSNHEFFPYRSEAMPLREYWDDHALPAAREALRASGLTRSPVRRNPKLTELFGYIETPTPLQAACAEQAISNGPQLFILEDVTGAGKTEAAALLAARLLAAGQGQGLYIGLPTMATANAMYERMASVYRHFFANDARPNLVLSHGARHLSDAFRESLLEQPADDRAYGDEESIGAQCNRWLADNRKKALLAEVGVGTIDQALLAILPARHQSLRLLGLSDKVLLLDEVHAYDAYTSEHIKTLIRFHAALGNSLVLLSATLTRRQRSELAEAFAPGAGKCVESGSYPLLTHVTADGPVHETPVATRASVARAVKTDFVHDEAEVIERIRQAVENGQCVCWIRNTVADARDAWRQLADADWLAPDRLHLFHSRYAYYDRIAIEQDIVSRFGKDSTEKHRAGHVLIATQVVEQSLDLDFDLMISDLAPIDLLIQRAGRLHRHARGDRGTPLLIVHAPPFDDDPQADWYEQHFPKAQFVYADTLVLWRSQKVLAEKGGWRMPDDARVLLEFVYDKEGDIPAGLVDTNMTAEGDETAERDLASYTALRLESGYQRDRQWDEDARIATRLGDESRTVYLARWQDGQLRPWAEDERYRWDMSSLSVRPDALVSVSIEDDAELEAALERLRESELLFDEHSLILPLRQEGDHWVARGRDEKGRSLQILYDSNLGLELEREA
ncbi:CRISPR-associated helicase Cas3' [Thiolapillus sp.]